MGMRGGAVCHMISAFSIQPLAFSLELLLQVQGFGGAGADGFDGAGVFGAQSLNPAAVSGCFLPRMRFHSPAHQEDRMVRDFFGMIAGIPRRGVQCLGINSRENNAYECLPG